MRPTTTAPRGGPGDAVQTFEIKSRWDGRVLYSAGGESLRDVVVQAVRERAYLIGSNLSNANLSNANLINTDLSNADLSGVNLRDANLIGSNLRDAYLRGANLIGARSILMLGPLGSRSDYLTAYTTDAGVYVRAGCFFGSLADFRAAVADTHGDSIHGREYAAAIVMIEAHVAIWTPTTVAEAE